MGRAGVALPTVVATALENQMATANERQLRQRIAWLEGTAMPHARRQENANGFQKGWHAALSRVSEGDSVSDLSAVVPQPSADVDDTLPWPLTSAPPADFERRWLESNRYKLESDYQGWLLRQRSMEKSKIDPARVQPEDVSQEIGSATPTSSSVAHLTTLQAEQDAWKTTNSRASEGSAASGPTGSPRSPQPEGSERFPGGHIIHHAIGASTHSPCRSKRGAVVFAGNDILSWGFNHKPKPFSCDGSAECKEHCRLDAVHAEQRALLLAGFEAQGADVLHVKTVDGKLVASGGPSCLECSKLMLAAGIAGVWLYHELGWRRYLIEEFHALTLRSIRRDGTGGGNTTGVATASTNEKD